MNRYLQIGRTRSVRRFGQASPSFAVEQTPLADRAANEGPRHAVMREQSRLHGNRFERKLAVGTKRCERCGDQTAQRKAHKISRRTQTGAHASPTPTTSSTAASSSGNSFSGAKRSEENPNSCSPW